jgi:CRP/FNR family transcriptional regulator, anaerobic regulatory protein
MALCSIDPNQFNKLFMLPSTLTLKNITSTNIKTACSTCSLSELCLPVGLTPQEVASLDKLVTNQRKLKRGEHLHHIGLDFHSLFTVRIGYFKTYVLERDGREQVTGFHMAGEVLGLEAISTDVHKCNAVALEDSEVCEVPFARLEEFSHSVPSLMHHFHKMMSREIVRDHGLLLLLGSMKAEERLATFLLNLSHRFAMRGYSATEFLLRMTREEIGSYLGMKLETVSRTFSKLQEQGLIEINSKQVKLRDIEALRRMIGHHACD